MEGHFSFIASFISDPILQKFVTAVILVLLVCFVMMFVSSKVSTKAKRKNYIVPKKFSLVTVCDFFVEAFVKYHDSIIGVENRKYVPFSGSVFLFLLLSNLLGMIPGMVPITTTITINLSMALIVFIYFNYWGIKVNGVAAYIRHFAGPVLLLAPLFFVLEIISTVLRVLTLNLRLYWNISADHAVMSAFMGIHPSLGILAYFLGFFVAFIQAFVFTTLTIIYIQLAVQHSEEE